ncbi:MAG: MarR family winged helix-turn-helix transcriptional regulator [Verrucomicrobiales bacterium]
MKTAEDKQSVKKIASEMADFIMYTQRSFLLDLSKELNRGNVSYAQFFLLGYLASEDYLTMTNISRKMGHSTAAATGLVDRLEKLGYVQRLHASDDRRKVMVQITRKGQDLVQQLRENIAENVADLMAHNEGTPATVGRAAFDKAAEFIRRP